MRAADIGLPPVLANGDAWVKRGSDRVGHGVDRMTLGAAVFMIDEEPLVVPRDQPGPHQLRHRPADCRHAGFADTLTDFRLDQAVGLGRITWKLSPADERSSNLVGGRAALMMTRAAGCDRRGQPFADRHKRFAFANERSRLPVGPRNPRDQIKHHEGIARPRGVLGDDAYDIGHARRSLGRRREEVLLDHGTNQAQSWTLVNPPKLRGDNYDGRLSGNYDGR